MQSGRLHFQGSLDTNRPRVRNEFRSRSRIIESFDVLGKTLTTAVKSGTTVEQALIKAVEENGGKVFRKFYPQFNKHEITAIVFRDCALVKNDPEHIAKQDFSCFGAKAQKIKKMAIREAQLSKEGLHIFENEFGIPVIEMKDGQLVFPSPDEMLVNGQKKKIEKTESPIDPKTRGEFKKGAVALAKNDLQEIERLRKVSGDHGQTREKEITATSDYILLDRFTGDEMGAGARNSKLGRNLVFASAQEFVPQKLLIQQFHIDSQIQKDRYQQTSWDWLLQISNTFRNEDIELPSVYTSFTFERAVSSNAAQSSEVKEYEKETSPAKQKLDGSRKLKAPVKFPSLAIPKHALMFDGFPRIDWQKIPFKPKEKTEPAVNLSISKSLKIANRGIQKVDPMKELTPIKTIRANKPNIVSVIQKKKTTNARKKPSSGKIKAKEINKKIAKKKEKKKPKRINKMKPVITKKKAKAKKPESRKIKTIKTKKHLAPKISIRKAKSPKKIQALQKPKAEMKKAKLKKIGKKAKPANNNKAKITSSKKREIRKKNEKRKERIASLIKQRNAAKSSSRKRAKLLSLIL